MSKKVKRSVPPSMPPRRRWSRWIFVALAVPVAVAYSSALVARARGQVVIERLPAVPDWASQPPALARAVDESMAALRAVPDGPGAGSLGELYQANDYYDEAAACYRIALDIDPAEPKWPYLLAYLLVMKGQTGPEIDRLLDRTLELDPQYVPALLRRAENHENAGKLDAALDDYRRCLDTNSRDPYALIGVARIDIDRGQWDAAERCLMDALEADQNFGAAHRLMASVHGHFGSNDEQAQSLERADAAGRFRAPPDPWADAVEVRCFKTDTLLTQAFRAIKTGQTEKAQAIYERTISIDPGDSEAYWRLGTLLLPLRQSARAEALFRKALDLGIDDPTRYPIVYNNLGQALLGQGRAAESIEHFEHAIALDPEFDLAHTNLAYVLVQLGRLADAVNHCERAVAINPVSDGAHYNWGIALIKLDDAESAAEHFARALEINPNLATAHYQLGVYLERTGQHELALDHFRRALDTTTDPNLAARIRTMLK